MHSPLKSVEEDESEPTLSDLMKVLKEHGRKMATKQDLCEMHKEIMRDTRLEISHAVDPIKDEIADVKERTKRLEENQIQ
eukprot:12403528-Karenia_brevis.AAC.1